MKRSDIDDRHVVELARRWKADPRQPGVVAALVNEGIPPKLAQSKVESLVKKGLLDYGVSVNYAWPATADKEQS